MVLDLSEFKNQDNAAWNKAAEKALKGKPLSGLNWKVDDIINMQPIYTADQSISGITLGMDRKDNRWYIGESFDGSSAIETNDLLLKALQGGLDAPLFFDVSDFNACLDQVSLDFLFPIFRDCGLEEFLNYIVSTDFDPKELIGGFIQFEAGYGDIDISDVVDSLSKISKELPRYYHSMISVSIDTADIGKSMARSLNQLSEMICQMKSKNIPPRIICEVECDPDFVKNVALLRALRQQVNRICEVYEIPVDSILLDVYVYQSGQDTQLAMIGASAKAVSAVSAGVDRLTIECESMNVQMDEDTRRRMSRNVHHLMMMESGLDKVVDPLGGSYSIETLTKKIAERSWSEFQLLNK